MSEHDWPEDYKHENGNYSCKCINAECGAQFTGHKRRQLCKSCHIGELERQLGATEAENDILQRGHDDVCRKLRKTLEEHSTLREAVNAAIDCGMVPTTSASDGGAAKYGEQVKVADMLRAALKDQDSELAKGAGEMSKEITFEFATRDDCLDQMVPSDLRVLVAQRDRLEQQLVDLLSEYRKDCIAYAHWFRSGVNRNGRTEGECFDIWLALKEQDNG